jgi:hypothetical protein
MIGILILAAAVQATPAAQPSFGFACKVEGTLNSDGKLAPFAQRRPLAFFVERNESGLLAPSKTIDPTGLLSGKQVSVFRVTPIGYGGSTGLSMQDTALSFQPSKTSNEWTVALAPVSSGALPSPTLTVGKCLLMDGITGPQFDQLAPTLSQMK